MSLTSSARAVVIEMELLELRARVAKGYRYIEDEYRRPGQLVKGGQRLQTLIAREYLPALKALLDEYGRDELGAYCAALVERLDRGWDVLAEDARQSWVDGWLELLREYEVVCDALATSPGEFFPLQLDRIARAMRRQGVTW